MNNGTIIGFNKAQLALVIEGMQRNKSARKTDDPEYATIDELLTKLTHDYMKLAESELGVILQRGM